MSLLAKKLLHFLNPKRLLTAVVDRCVYLLTTPHRAPEPSDATNVMNLQKRLEKGDVILVSGNARISSVVKILTLSPWSHVVLYVGDRSDLLSEEQAEEWSKRFGEQSLKHLVIDADPILRVHLKPLEEYAGLMMRHCRPEALNKDDRDKVCEHALGQLGREYDIKHIIRLLGFFAFPWELLPETLRRMVTDFTLSEDDRICSRVLSQAFHSVGYPIRPLEIVQNRSNLHTKALGVAFGFRRRAKTAAKLLMAGRLNKAKSRFSDNRYTEIHLREERHITPADYDLSRFFSIIKDKGDLEISYRSARSVCRIK